MVRSFGRLSANATREEVPVEYDHETQVFNFIAGLVLGAVIGAGIAILTAPESGRKTRRRVRRMAGEIRKGAGSRLGDLTDDVRGRVDEAVRGARKRLS
jgi:gas vesicle protein